MDEIKLSLKTRFMRGVVSRLIDKAILKQTGVKVDINLNELEIDTENGDAYIKVNLIAKVDEKEVIKLMSKL